MTRTRKVSIKLDNLNPIEAVEKFAAKRLSSALDGIRVFGQCFGSRYDWTNEQIIEADTLLLGACTKAIEQIQMGSKIAGKTTLLKRTADTTSDNVAVAAS